MIPVDVTVNAEPLLASLGAIDGRLGDPRPYLDQQASVLEGELRRNLDEELTPDGQMDDLTERYARYKERHWPGKTILKRTDAMYNSIKANEPDGLSVTASTHGIDYAWHTAYFLDGSNKRNFGFIRQETSDRILAGVCPFLLRGELS